MTLGFLWPQVERGLTLDVGMKLFGLEHSELLWEKALDTKLLIAWNNSRILIAFRGTASLANALADVQVTPPVDNSPVGALHELFLRLAVTRRKQPVCKGIGSAYAA